MAVLSATRSTLKCMSVCVEDAKGVGTAVRQVLRKKDARMIHLLRSGGDYNGRLGPGPGHSRALMSCVCVIPPAHYPAHVTCWMTKHNDLKQEIT